MSSKCMKCANSLENRLSPWTECGDARTLSLKLQNSRLKHIQILRVLVQCLNIDSPLIKSLDEKTMNHSTWKRCTTCRKLSKQNKHLPIIPIIEESSVEVEIE